MLNEFSDVISNRHLYLLAGGIAYNAFLCAIPFLLTLLAGVGIVSDPKKIEEYLQFILGNILPPGSLQFQLLGIVQQELPSVFDFAAAASWVGAVGMLWTSSALLSSLRSALNFIWETPTPHFFLYYKLRDIGSTLLLLLLVSTSALLPSALALTTMSSFLPWDLVSWLDGITLRIIDYISVAVLLWFVYAVIPAKAPPEFRRKRRKKVWVSVPFAFVLWQIARILFDSYFEYAGSYGKIYGTFAIIAALAFWIYYSAFIILFAAASSHFIVSINENKTSNGEGAVSI